MFNELNDSSRIRDNINIMPDALRELAKEIRSPDDIPAMCLLDAADMIEMLRRCVADAIRSPIGITPDSCDWITVKELDEAALRREVK